MFDTNTQNLKEPSSLASKNSLLNMFDSKGTGLSNQMQAVNLVSFASLKKNLARGLKFK